MSVLCFMPSVIFGYMFQIQVSCVLDSAVIQEWCRSIEGNERIPGTVSRKCRVCDDGAAGSMSIHHTVFQNTIVHNHQGTVVSKASHIHVCSLPYGPYHPSNRVNLTIYVVMWYSVTAQLNICALHVHQLSTTNVALFCTSDFFLQTGCGVEWRDHQCSKWWYVSYTRLVVIEFWPSFIDYNYSSLNLQVLLISSLLASNAYYYRRVTKL